MPQIFTCTNPQCGKKMTVPDELLGREVHCPHCVQRMQVGPKLAHRSGFPAASLWFLAGIFITILGVLSLFALVTPLAMMIVSCGFLALILSQVWR
jgi:hypothetical protein